MAAILRRPSSAERADHAVEADASIAHVAAVDSCCIYNNGPYPRGSRASTGAGRAACSKPGADELSRVATSTFMPGYAPAPRVPATINDGPKVLAMVLPRPTPLGGWAAARIAHDFRRHGERDDRIKG